jgi:tRNA/rRNA methyltransferase
VFVRVVLVGIEGAVNLGFIARTCMNFGVDELYLVNPRASIMEALRYSAKASNYLLSARIVSDLTDAIQGVDLVAATTAKGYSVGDVIRQAIPLKDFIELIRGRVERLAILFGRESTGLTREELRVADVLVTIPANPKYPVLNISQAVAIILWELWNIRGFRAENIPPPAGRDELYKLLSLFEEVSRRTIINEDKIRRVMEIWKKIILRSRLSIYEVKLVEYWIRKILSRIKG